MIGTGLSVFTGAVRKRGAGGVVVVTTNALVANRLQAPTGTMSVTASGLTSYREHYSSPQGATNEIQTVDVGWTLTGAFSTAVATSYTISRTIERAGVFYTVLWAGQPTVVVAPGAIVVSDPISGLVAPASSLLGERTFVSAASTTVPCVELPASSVALGLADGNFVGDRVNGGAISPSSGVLTIGCVAMKGTIAVAGARAAVGFGDSLLFGTGDETAVGARKETGWTARGLGSRFPFLKIARGGSTATGFAADATGRIEALLAVVGFTDAIFEHGLNDLSQASRTKAQILASNQTNYAKVPGKRIWQCTITPRTTSTDAFATVENQTPKTDGNMAALTPLNIDIRAKPANVFGVIDAADAAMSARDSNVFSGPFPPVIDGTHMLSPKHAAMASAMNAVMVLAPAVPVVTPLNRSYADTSASDTFPPLTGTFASTGSPTSFTLTGSTGTTTLTKVGTYGTLAVIASGAGIGNYTFTANNAAINAVESGSPTDPFEVRGVNTTGPSDPAAFTVTINGVAEVTAPTLISIGGSPGPATIGVAYSFTPTTANGAGVKVWTRSGDALPTGWTFSTTTGETAASAGNVTTAATINSVYGVSDDTGTANPPLSAAIVVSAAATAFVVDSFTGTDGTAMTAHAAETGGGWTLLSAGTASLLGNAARGDSATITAFVASAAVPPTADYEVEAPVSRTNGTAAQDSTPGVFARAADSSNMIYWAFVPGSSAWQLAVTVASAITVLESSTAELLPANTVRIAKLRVVGSVYTASLDGVVIFTRTDATAGRPTAAGKLGFRTRAAGRINSITATAV